MKSCFFTINKITGLEMYSVEELIFALRFLPKEKDKFDVTKLCQGDGYKYSKITWPFSYDDVQLASISIKIVAKKNTDQVFRLGLPLRWFLPNSVIDETFPLKACHQDLPKDAQMSIRIHLCENGSPPFIADEGYLLVRPAWRQLTPEEQKRYDHQNTQPAQSDQLTSYGLPQIQADSQAIPQYPQQNNSAYPYFNPNALHAQSKQDYPQAQNEQKPPANDSNMCFAQSIQPNNEKASEPKPQYKNAEVQYSPEDVPFILPNHQTVTVQSSSLPNAVYPQMYAIPQMPGISAGQSAISTPYPFMYQVPPQFIGYPPNMQFPMMQPVFLPQQVIAPNQAADKHNNLVNETKSE